MAPVLSLPTMEEMPASTVRQLIQVDQLRRNLGRIGDAALSNDDHPTFTLNQLTVATELPAIGFPRGVAMRRVDEDGRLKLLLDDGDIGTVLGWQPGGLESVLVDGWLLLTQTPDSVNLPRRRNGAHAGLSVHRSGKERVALRRPQLEALRLGTDRQVLLAAVPHAGALVVVNPLVIAAFAPAHVRAALTTGDTQ